MSAMQANSLQLLLYSLRVAYQFSINAFAKVIKVQSDIANLSFHDQWDHLVLGPLSKLINNSHHSSHVFVIDALDKCGDESNVRILLRLLAEAGSVVSIRLRVFLTSRPEFPIRYGFCEISDMEYQDFVLHNISLSIVDHDISIFLEYNLRLIRQERSQDAAWPGEESIGQLLKFASGIFI